MLNLKNNNSSSARGAIKQIESDVEYNSPFIFTKKINTNYKLVPFNIVENDVGKTKYLPPVSKEWKNTVYNYSPKNNINYPIYDLNINSLIRGYFSLYFNNKFLQHKYISRRTKRKSLNRIFVSKAEIKHTNEKAIITLYVFNKERLSLLKRIKKIKKFLGFGLKNRISFMTDKWMNFLSYVSKENKSSNLIDTPLASTPMEEEKRSESINNSLSLLLKFNVNDRLRKINFLYYMRNKRFFKKVNKVFSTFRRLKLKLSLNKYKFEEKFLSKLSQSISKYYGKKVEFNIVNLKSIAYNTDIFTEILTIKLRKPKSSPMRRINSLLSKVALPKVNTIIERGRVEKQVDRELIDNKYRNININHILNKLSEQDINSKDNLNRLLYNLYYKTILDNSNVTMESVVPLKTKNSKDNISSFSSGDLNKAYYSNLCNIIFENIKYKAMGGARLIVKGRLTKRYRADRAVYKLKWKGGLKNIDSAFKGLSTVQHLGYQDSNVTKSFMASKRRIGSFGVKAWMSGKNYSTMSYQRQLISPVVQYSNVAENKSLIIKENKGKAGVYRWVNNLNGNSYVGSSIDLGVRLRDYFNINFISREIKINKSRIYRALRNNKYQHFSLEILEYCDPSLTLLNEQKYLDSLNPEYNILKIAGSLAGFKHSENTLAKMKARVLTLEQKVRHLEAMKKVHGDEEFKANRLEDIMRYNTSEKRKQDMERLSHAVEVTNTLTNIKNVYPSKAEAARAIGCSAAAISIVLKEFKETGIHRPVKKIYLVTLK